MNANEIFYKKYQGRTNFITPVIVERELLTPTRAYELAKEHRLTRQLDTFPPIFGITVLDYDPATDTVEMNYELTKSVHSMAEARSHINTIKGSAA